MRIVCDTNVLISGFLFGGNPREVLQLCSLGKVINCISPAIIDEVEEVLHRPKFTLSSEQVYRIIGLFRDTFTMVIPENPVDFITIDPDDNRILEAAEAASAQIIVSGDKHLLELVSWKDIHILSPGDFLRALGLG
ncbi:MAG: putative toxin-antitoxin system toxin component, PIN family [Chlorobiaceae bacterium]|nr:putative toxin-antitoxin system toxin component, PIN family [Chlorobiaceae bacterium]